MFESPTLTPQIEQLLDHMAAHGYAMMDHWLSEAEILTLHNEALALQDTHQLTAAGTGEHKQLHREIRGDAIHWIEPALASNVQHVYLDKMQALQSSLNAHFFLGLFEFETHFAVYPPGAVYRKHLDQLRGSDARQVSAILYLNPGWTSADGGALRLYLDDQAKPSEIDILPIAGRLVVFLSGRFFHEVLPSRRQRVSLTGWFRTRSRLP